MPRGINSCGIESYVVATNWAGGKRYGAVTEVGERQTSKPNPGASIQDSTDSSLSKYTSQVRFQSSTSPLLLVCADLTYIPASA